MPEHFFHLIRISQVLPVRARIKSTRQMDYSDQPHNSPIVLLLLQPAIELASQDSGALHPVQPVSKLSQEGWIF